MEETLSYVALAVLGFHRDHPEESGHAGHLIGCYKEVQTLEDLDDIYQMLEGRRDVQASAGECAAYLDENTEQRIFRTKFQYKGP
jgi:hypothetical protein